MPLTVGLATLKRHVTAARVSPLRFFFLCVHLDMYVLGLRDACRSGEKREVGWFAAIKRPQEFESSLSFCVLLFLIAGKARARGES